MLQHLTVKYSFSYISWLQLAAEYGCCNHLILTSPLRLGYPLKWSIIAVAVNVVQALNMGAVLTILVRGHL